MTPLKSFTNDNNFMNRSTYLFSEIAVYPADTNAEDNATKDTNEELPFIVVG